MTNYYAAPTGSGATTTTAEYIALLYSVEDAAARHQFAVSLLVDLLEAETRERRRDFLETLLRLVRRGDFAAARSFLDDEVF